MSRWLVVGGFGFYGAKVVDALRQRGHEVHIGTRRPSGRPSTRRVDLADPATYLAVHDFDGVVNSSDSVGAPPDAAIDYVLRAGGVWFEMGADAPTLSRLASRASPPDARGTVVLGVGIFPGLSTALARWVAEARPTCHLLELGIRLSPLSGAGAANCALMAESLFVPVSWVEAGAWRQGDRALGIATVLPYDDGTHLSVRFSLPDTALLARTLGVDQIASSMALIPGWLRFNFAVLASLAALVRRRLPRLRGWLASVLTWQLRLLRAVLLRSVESPVQISVLADRGLATERSASLRFADGQQATADGVAAALAAFERLDGRPTGLLGLIDLFDLPTLLAELSVAPGFQQRSCRQDARL